MGFLSRVAGDETGTAAAVDRGGGDACDGIGMLGDEADSAVELRRSARRCRVTRMSPMAAPAPERSRPCFHATVAIALFLLIWGAKLAVIDRFGSDVPFWDQWAKEGELTYAPWLERGEFWRNLFVPHNEHRIAPTLAVNLALVMISGQWDARV